MIKEEHAKGF